MCFPEDKGGEDASCLVSTAGMDLAKLLLIYDLPRVSSLAFLYLNFGFILI
jgi:hypothetical protein